MLELLLAVCLLAGCPAPQPAAQPSAEPTTHEAAPSVDPVVQSLQSKPLHYTHHARCRMGCRDFDEAEVEHVLSTGTLDPSRTRLNGECPSYALEGDTPDGQHARMVFAGCEQQTRVVTVIDLGSDHDCDCD